MKRATLEEMKAATYGSSNAATYGSSNAATPPRTMWVNILNRWFVMSQDIKTVGDALTVAKRDGSTQDVTIEEIVGTFEDKVIYKVRKDAVA